MRMGQGVRTSLGHGGITCVLQTQFSSSCLFNLFANGLFDLQSSLVTLLSCQSDTTIAKCKKIQVNSRSL